MLDLLDLFPNENYPQNGNSPIITIPITVKLGDKELFGHPKSVP